MYLLLIGEAGHPEADITFALLTLFALGVPVRYVVKMINGQSWNELDREGQLLYSLFFKGKKAAG